MVLVLGVTVGVVVLSGLWLVPRLIEQLGELINAAPGWLEQAQNQLNVLQEKALERGIPTDLSPLTDDLLARSTRLARSLSQQLLGLLSATLGLTVNSIIVLVLAVFLLLGGETISAGLARWVPADWRELVVSRVGGAVVESFETEVLERMPLKKREAAMDAIALDIADAVDSTRFTSTPPDDGCSASGCPRA